MELNQILDEIQNDLPDQDPSLLPEATPPASQEVQPPSEEDQGSDLLKTHVQALEHYKTCQIYSRALDARPTLDKALALEIFTMLPNLNEPLTVSKLTSAASAHNKTLLADQLKRYQPSPESMLPMFEQLMTVIQETCKTIEELTPTAKAVKDQVHQHFTRIRDQANVVFCRKPIDLLITPFEQVYQINDLLLDFPPYENKLINAFYKVARTNGADRLFPEAKGQMSLVQIRNVISLAPEILEGYATQLDHFQQTALHVFEPEVVAQLDFQNLKDIIYNVKRYKAVYQDDQMFLNAFMELLELLQ